MIETTIVRQVSSYEPVAYLLERALVRIQGWGYKVLNVIETKDNKIPGLSDQAFIILYETENDEREREVADADITDKEKMV